MDGYALASPHVDRADEAPGLPVAPCPRCGDLRVAASPCPCTQVGPLSPVQRRLLARLAEAGSSTVRRHEAPVAAALARRGLVVRQRGSDPGVHELTRLGRALSASSAR